MKNKILMIGILVVAFVLASNVYAVSQNMNSGTSGNGGVQVQQQTQTANQGEAEQIKVQNSEQVQKEDDDEQEDEQEQEVEMEVQTQNKMQNRNEDKSGTAVAEQRRSNVANAVQEMLQLADRNGGIGQQVRAIAQTQNQNQEKLEVSLQKVKNRDGFASFLIGPNYGEINNAQKIIEQNREQIQQLNQIRDQLVNSSDTQMLTQQIQTLEQANVEIEDSLQNAQKGFSLFGWMFRLFYR